MERNILLDYLNEYSSEILNMLYTEFNMEDAKSVWLEEGMEKGISQTARAMLAEGMSLDLIAKITGLSKDEIANLK
jgi:predicted transposase/invertase (TIGR01784 family)